jgi:cell shape-determining protein MreC
MPYLEFTIFTYVPTSYYNTIVSNMSSKRKMMEKEEAPLQKSKKELENLEEKVARLREENFRLRDCLGAIPAEHAPRKGRVLF